MIAAALLAAAIQANAVDVCKGPVTALAFGPAGVLYAGGENTLIQIGPTGSIERRFEGVVGKVAGVCSSPDGELITFVGGVPHESGLARTIGRGGIRNHFLSTDSYSAVAFQPNPEAIWLGEPDGAIGRWRLPRADQVFLDAKLTGHSGAVYALSALPGGGLLSGGKDGTLRLWQGEQPKLIRSLAFHTGPIYAIVVPGIVQGPIWCATASEDKTIRIWQPEIGRMVRIIKGAEGPLLALAVTPDGTRILSGGAEGIVRLQSADGGEPVATWTVAGEWIHSVAVSWDGKRAAFGASDGKVRLVDLPNSPRSSSPL